jgi:hypothetical protein
MLKTRLGVLAVFPLLFAMTQLSDVGVAHLAPSKMGHARFSRIKDKVEHGDGTATSSNWSGWAVTGTAFTSAQGSWVVPTGDCTSRFGDSYAAFWVGLDGYTSDTVEQTGTLIECVGRRAEYANWYEFYPSNLVEISSVPVSPGNKISASVVYAGGESFTTTITNETTGKSFSITQSVSGAQRTSAEWIAEAPCCTVFGGILPLANFGTADFGAQYSGVANTNYSTEGTAASQPISAYGTTNAIDITKGGSSSSPQTSTCSALTDAGSSFTCSWAN